MNVDEALLQRVVQLSGKAGGAILEVYQRTEGYDSTIKSDNSPVTEADLAAHAVLVPELNAIDPEIPVLSEESELPEFTERSTWGKYWIIDPLDGTKEFIKRNGEFTVNIALIENGEPILGVVHVPVLGITYAGGKNIAARKLDRNGTQPISVRSIESRQKEKLPIEVVASRSHGADAVERLMAKISEQIGAVETKNMGSSLKLCLVAEGAADIYPRLALTSEWDTAAAHAVVNAAGGEVLDIDLNPLKYNQKDDILNPFFYVLGDTNFDWRSLLNST